MAPSPLQQRRTHNTLLFQKLLNLRDGASPFTLVVDSLEQRGNMVVGEFVRRAKISKTNIIFISFSTLRKKIPYEVNTFISTRGKSLATLRDEILSYLPPPPTAAPKGPSTTKTLLIIDTFSTLSTTHPHQLTPFLTSLLTSPSTSLIATFHIDIPLPSQTTSHSPIPLQTLQYLATTILTISSLPQVLSRKRARDKSLQEPVFGVAENREGLIKGLAGKGKSEEKGIVISMEMRRRSGRGALETFVLIPSPSPSPSLPTKPTAGSNAPEIVLLDEHPLYAPCLLSTSSEIEIDMADKGQDNGGGETTFSLSLTEKQKKDREAVVLPYFDAQSQSGGMGGRILYEMGREDREDFDDEEDEL